MNCALPLAEGATVAHRSFLALSTDGKGVTTLGGRAGLLDGRMRLNQAQSDETISSRLDSNNRSGQFGGALFDSVSKKKGQPSDISFDFTLGQSTVS